MKAPDGKTWPVMPAQLADVPAWLRSQASRWNLRVLFLADSLEQHLDQRDALNAAAAAAGIEVVDLPSGLTDEELHAFMADTIARAQERPATPPLAGAAGRIVGSVLNDLVAPLRCPHCGDRFRTASDMTLHVRDTGDGRGRTRPAAACPVLWRMRGNDRPAADS